MSINKDRCILQPSQNVSYTFIPLIKEEHKKTLDSTKPHF